MHLQIDRLRSGIVRICNNCDTILNFYEFPFDTIDLCFKCWEKIHGKLLHSKDERKLEKISHAQKLQKFGPDFDYDRLFDKFRNYRYLKYFKPQTRKSAEQKKINISIRANGLQKCPICGADMVLRNGKYGKFYGCSRFPHCRGTSRY